MKPFLLILATFIFAGKAYSQNIIEIKIEIGAKRRITSTDVGGNFQGGDTVWRDAIKKRLNTSAFVARDAKKGNYTVKVYYITAKDGSIADVHCENDPGYGICQEAVRAVLLSRKWKSAQPAEVKVRI